MTKIEFFVLFFLFLTFCSKPKELGKTVIIAENMDIPADKVYLTTMEKRALVLDSAKISDGSFQFNLTEEMDPFKAYIAYRNKEGKLSMVYFKNNDPDSADSFTYSEFFVVERGKTHLKGKAETNKQFVFASVIGGEENKLLFNPGYESLGNVDHISKERYEESFESVKKSVENYPFSFLLIEKVYANRGNYKKNDLQYILSKMNAKVIESTYGYNLGIYLKNLPDNYNPFKAFPVLNKENVYVTDYDRKEKLNMLILTATWSHSSNLLLHYMNLEKQNFEIEDLYVVDIGVDDLESWWWQIKGSKRNSFVWDEFYVPVERRQIFLGLHDCNGFPLIIFTNQEGKEIKRFWDEEYRNIKNYKYNSKNLEEMKSFIENYLK